jgi:hypothetical protein
MERLSGRNSVKTGGLDLTLARVKSMSGWVLFPITAFGLGTVVALAVGLVMAILRPTWSHLKRVGLVIIFPLVFWIILVLFTLLFISEERLKAMPSDNWQEKAQQADAALVFGYGLGRPVEGQMRPGESNKELLSWTIKNTSASVLLVQEGVWTVVCPEAATECAIEGRILLRMHENFQDIRVNTAEAARCAADQLITQKVEKVVVAAHDLQLELAAWDLRQILKHLGRDDIDVIVPDLPQTASPGTFVQPQTGMRFIYRLTQIFVGRPRDYFGIKSVQCPKAK